MAFTQSAALALLTQAHQRARLAHAYLISGPIGSGKRELAAQICGLVSGPSPQGGLFGEETDSPLKNPDVHVVEPESKSRRIVIEQIRGLERELQMRSAFGGRKVGLVFDADRLVPGAANAFLKTLEEPPGNSLLVLTSANPESMLETILSRCVLVALRPTQAVPPTPAQTRLLAAVGDFFRDEKAGLAQVFQLVRHFTELLIEAKEAIRAGTEADLEKEQDHYKTTTDSDWLDDREDYYKALTESRYLQQRAALIETLLQWLADVLRQQSDFARLDHSAVAVETAAVARRFSTPQILKKFAALEELRENFGRNVHEQLAIEAAFLKAFAA